MKKYLVLDTETTGLDPGQICQLSYLIFDENFRIEKIFNKFYTVESVEKGASDIHGFTKERLDVLSQGRFFRFDVYELLEDFNRVEKIIIHNKVFDLKFLKSEINSVSIPNNFENKSFCTMEYHTTILKLPGKVRNGNEYKYPKLSETMNYYSISNERVEIGVETYFQCENICLHDARFDVYGLYLICKEMKKRKAEEDEKNKREDDPQYQYEQEFGYETDHD